MKSNIKNGIEYVFIVDTNSYSGNFERELCAYITGRIGECQVGYEESEFFIKEVPKKLAFEFARAVKDIPDEYGFLRPCSIATTPSRGNDGCGKHGPSGPKYPYPAYESVEIYFEEKPSDEMIDLMKSRSQDFAQRKNIKICGFRLLEKKIVVTTVSQETSIPV